ncbi:MAG: YegP family protein [Pseudodesulfovibrio sp.]|uniref:DUF1508 domain-containing protein n=1 Tax=Pseudodesulfovibrio indicus TaxID=1716143 RepID=A0A126QL37_9BACT|nr:YegP family protein [Pseudodesulfovibrio indicus]AMK10486.1 hypothetical protein AWY79_04815 [Pseudodesulfovibrio indicus]TDT89116.1 hypothetical protein EDC59_104109 [Pseudodesulfovibrio indicus]
MPGKYERKPTTDGQWMFNLLATNGQIILTSERYTTKDACTNGIASVQTNSPLDERYERRQSKAGEPYFVLKAANHQIIGVSEMYSSAQAMEKGIESVKANGPTTTIIDILP